ncbi:MAG: uroporphyrinogen decarboxylase family protein [Anaerolineae bacterium]
MTPRQRLLKTLRGEIADRVPLVLPGFEFVSRRAIEGHPDPLRREIAHRVFDQVAYHVQVPSYINRYLVTPPQRMHRELRELPNGFQEIRGTIDTPKGELTFTTQYDPVSHTTWTMEYPVKTMDDIEAIASVSWELPADLAPPSRARPGEAPVDFDTRGILETRISSPFVCVAGMMKFEQFLELTATEPDLVDELTEICRRRSLDVLKVLFSEPGIEYLWIGGSEWVTPPMASPRTYDRLVQEQERDLIAYAHEQDDVVVHVHCHGHVRHALQRTIERGADYTEPVEPPPDGDITMVEAKALADGRITLGGNVECRVLCNGTPDEVRTAVHAAFAGGKTRFVLRPTEAPSPTMTEQEARNWMTMVKVWEEEAGY